MKNGSGKKLVSKWSTIIPAVVAWSLLVGFIGYQIHQHNQDKYARQAAQAAEARTASEGTQNTRRGGGTGTVIKVSSDSISYTEHRSNTDKTYKITRSTRITEKGVDKTYKDIKTGSVVLIWTRSSDTEADLIVINPNMDGSARP